MALDAKVQADADAALDAAVADLRARQAGVKGATGKYRQCRPDDWGSWEAQKPDPAAVVAWVDEYLAPDGPGYTVSGEVTDGDGVAWRRTIHVTGPEAWREAAWTAVEAEER